ncbi:MAG: PilW family protein [Methylotenera sp.]|nr:PilW family protein [Methylotenera sp.]
MLFIVQHPYIRAHRNQAGFSLIEIMVGLVIGLLVTLVIMQVFSVFEGQKRTTMGTADAQTNGNIALYNVQRDVQLAGYGLPVFAKTNSPLLCTSLGTSALSPVTITDGGAGAGASDTVTVRYGTTPLGGVPVTIGPPTTTAAPAVMVGVDNNMGCQVGDSAIIISDASCVLTRVIGPTDIAVPAVASASGTVNIELEDGTDVTSGASISCMGGWNAFTYAVNNNQLERNGAPNVADIVNMQAQYGISAAGNNNQITSWVDATGATWGAAMTVASRNRIKAVRIAIVARNGLLEKENVTAVCSSTADANPTGLCAWDATSANPVTASPAPEIDLSKNADGTDNADWRRYRYRVYETIIPIRSMIWSRAAL